MQTFNIYQKKKGIYWTKTLIIYSIIIPSLTILLIRQEIGVNTNIIDALLICLIIGSFAYGIIISFIGIVKYEPLKGHLNGFMVLNWEVIQLGHIIYNLNDIDKIEISNYDYKGQIKYRTRGSFEPILSQGVENEIIITSSSGEIEKKYFQQLKLDDLLKEKTY